MNTLFLLAQAPPNTLERIEIVGNMDPLYLEVILGLAILATGFSLMTFWRQRQIAKNQIEIAQLINELLSKK